MSLRRALPAIFLVLLAVASPALAQAPTTIAPGPLLGAGRFGVEEPSLLPIADEQVVERARNLLRSGYPDQARQMLDDVAARHPDDLGIL